MKTRVTLILVVGLMLVAAVSHSQSDCYIAGDIEAWLSDAPELGAWRYVLTVTWDTNVQYAVSHINLIVDDGTNCTCGDFTSALAWRTICGTSDGEPEPCVVQYYHEFNCNGDPSLGITDPLYKFEYDEDFGCEPANVGTAVISFYSDYQPVPTDLPNLLIVDKHGQLSCSGELTGLFPAMPCGPVADDDASWGDLKSGYFD